MAVQLQVSVPLQYFMLKVGVSLKLLLFYLALPPVAVAAEIATSSVCEMELAKFLAAAALAHTTEALLESLCTLFFGTSTPTPSVSSTLPPFCFLSFLLSVSLSLLHPNLNSRKSRLCGNSPFTASLRERALRLLCSEIRRAHAEETSLHWS